MLAQDAPKGPYTPTLDEMIVLSAKAKELEQNAHVAIVFYWPELEKQIRITGRATKVAKKESAKYFASRPRAAQ